MISGIGNVQQRKCVPAFELIRKTWDAYQAQEKHFKENCAPGNLRESGAVERKYGEFRDAVLIVYPELSGYKLRLIDNGNTIEGRRR